jgi:putative hydrolase of the HAD superfamily
MNIEEPQITVLFLDIGGVLLTNAWDQSARQQAAKTFSLDYGEMNERHHLTFDTYEEGKLGFDDYLDRVVFYQDRPFTREAFKSFLFAQSQPFPDTLDLMRRLKAHHNLKVAAVSNEGRELTVFRIQKFELDSLIDVFVSSCFVHYRKPDMDMYRIALDLVQVPPEQVAYIDDRSFLVDIAGELGIHSILHTSHESTRAALAQLGLALPG